MCDFCENREDIVTLAENHLELCKQVSDDKLWLYLEMDKVNRTITASIGSDTYVSATRKIEYCPMCGRKLSVETKIHSDPFRQISKEVAEEMGGKGEFDGDYAYPNGGFVDFDKGLAYIDFCCSNCGKIYENVLLGKKVVCDCGKTIRTDVFGRRKND